jgi:tol-pal system protein YbgF
MIRAMRFSLPAYSILAVTAILALGPGSAARAQGADPAAAQDEPSAKRLDRFEKELREVRQIVLQAHATGQPVEIKEAGPDPQLVALQGRIDETNDMVRHLTGEIETLTHQLELARKDADDSRAQTAALADRVDKLEKLATATAPPAPPPPPVAAGSGADANAAPQAPGPGDAKAAYAHARQMLEDGDYAGAAGELQAYVDHYGDTPTGPAARYWLGEAKFIQKDYAGAATAYLGAIRGWPKTAWAPEAVVKLSQALVELGKPQDACGALGELDRRYPHTTPATKARAASVRTRAQCAG